MLDRVKNFRRVFPQSHLCIVNGHIEGVWIVGNTYRSSASPSSYYGAYPYSYLRRVLSLFPDIEAPLHLFSGTVKSNCTLDIDVSVKPSICGDAQRLPIKSESLKLIVADPPYTERDAEKYGREMISRVKVFKECYRVLQKDSFLVWLDLIYPQFHWKQSFNFRLYGLIPVITSTNHRIRICVILQKKDGGLGD